MTSTLNAPRSAFRAHHARPAQVASPLFSQLIDEWIGLNQTRSTISELDRWAVLEPVLAGYSWPADIVDAIDAAENTVKDTMLLALLRLAQTGHQLAGRILLQQMLPSIGKLTKTSPSQPNSDNRWAEDRRHIAVASLFLAPGPMVDRAGELALEAGAVAVSDPLGAHPEVARTILARYAVGAVELVPV